MKSPQQKLADRIYELLPHKKELEFGCQFLWKEDLKDNNSYCAVFENWVTKNETVRCMTRPFFIQAVVEKSHITEIIGQPLRLADLLMAIGDDVACVGSKGGMGCFLEWEVKKTNRGTTRKDWKNNKNILYNLSKDNILDQSDELCEFCLGLLAKK